MLIMITNIQCYSNGCYLIPLNTTIEHIWSKGRQISLAADRRHVPSDLKLAETYTNRYAIYGFLMPMKLNKYD